MSRRMGYLLKPLEQALRCPHGHRGYQDAALVTGSTVLRCRFRPRSDGPPCSALVWVHRSPDGAIFVASVTHAEVIEIKAHRDVQQTLRYLGAPVWEDAA